MKLAVLIFALYASQCLGHGDHGDHGGHQEEGVEMPEMEMPDMQPVDDKKIEEFLKKSYVEIDVNKDGFVEADELRPFIARGFRLSLMLIDPDNVFDAWDTSKDKYVQRDELLKLRYKKTQKEIEETMDKMTPLDKIYYVYDMSKFELADKNKDGKLSKNELFYFLNSPFYFPRFEVESMWLLLDLDKDGKVPFEEFRKRTFGKHPDPIMDSESKDRALFDQNDLNKDGFFEFSEIRAMVIPDPKKESETNTQKMMEQYDEDKDGKLSKDEYMKSGFYMKDLDRPEVKEPQLVEDDVEGPPAEPKSKIDFELHVSKPKDEL